LYDGYTAAELISAFQSQQLQSYMNVASSCLFVYYFVTSIANEWPRMWTRKLALGMVLFFVSRYVTLAVSILNLVGMPFGVHNAGGCRVWFYLGWTFTIMINFNIAVYSTLRVWATSSHKKRYVIPIILLNAASIGINMAVYLRHIKFTVDITFSCSDAIRIGEQLDLTLSYTNKVCLILVDVYVIALTCIFTYPMVKQSNNVIFHSQVAAFLFRDGIRDFVILFVLTCLDLAYLRSFKLSNPLPTILDVITYISLCNFMLELRHVTNLDTEFHDSIRTVIDLDASATKPVTISDDTDSSIHTNESQPDSEMTEGDSVYIDKLTV